MDNNQRQFDTYEEFEERLEESKRRKSPLLGCAVAFLIFLAAFAVIVPIWLIQDDYDETYDSVEYAPDLRMDLSKLFEGEMDWNEGLNRLETLTTDLEKKKESMILDATSFSAALRQKENIYRLIERLEVYPNLLFDTNLDHDRASDMVAQISTKQSEVNERLSYFDEQVLKIPLEDLKAWSELSSFKAYSSDMEYWIEFYDYGFSAEQEALAASGQRLSEVPEELFETYHYLTDIPEGSFEYMDLVDEDPEVRAAVYKSIYEKNSIGAELLATALEGEVLANNYLAKLYGYDDAFKVALEADGIEPEEYEAFNAELKKGLVLLHRWKGIEKQLIGLGEEERLHAYDYAMPWIHEKYNLGGAISYEEASALIRRALEPLGHSYISTYEKLLALSIIDVLPRENKVNGAYTWGSYESGPYVLLNYYGDLEDMMTLGHEMGHAVHQELSRQNQSFSNYNASVLIAEMVATTNEALMFEQVLSNPDAFASESRESILIKYAQSIQDTIFMQLMASEFQRQIHVDVKEGINLDAAYLNSKWSDLVQEYFGPSYEVSETDGLGWTEMQHLYWGFYVQKYSIGYTAGISNAKRIVEDEGFATEYIQMLKDGGLQTPSDHLVAFGYGASGVEAVSPMLERFEWVLDEIEKSMVD